MEVENSDSWIYHVCPSEAGYIDVFSKPPTPNRYLKKILGGIALVIGVLFLGVFFSLITTVLQVGEFLDRTSWTVFVVVLCTGAAIEFFTRRIVNLVKEGGLSWETFGTFHGLVSVVQYGYWVFLALIIYAFSGICHRPRRLRRRGVTER